MYKTILKKARRLGNYIDLVATRHVTLGSRQYKLSLFDINRLALRASVKNYEPAMKALFARELGGNGGCFVDVGVNDGQTLMSILAIDPNIPYLGIEPQPGCAAQVNKFIVMNDLRKHRVICACISDVNAIVKLGFSYEGDVRASIVEEFRPKFFFTHSILTASISGDKLLKEVGIDSVALIKIDVEGAELEVLKSFKETLISNRPPVTFELLPDILVSTGQPLDQESIGARRKRESAIQKYLDEVRYNVFLLDGEYEIPCEIGPSPDKLVRNYVARPA